MTIHETDTGQYVIKYERRCSVCRNTITEFEHNMDCGCTQFVYDPPEAPELPSHWEIIEYKIAVGGDESEIPFE